MHVKGSVDYFKGPLRSSFLSCEKDTETILRKLFVESEPHSGSLKRLLVLPTKDCLDNTTRQDYKEKIEQMTLAKLREEHYIRLEPKLRFEEFEKIKSYIVISYDNFMTNNTNPHYRDVIVTFTILCHTDCWDIGNYRMRPLKIAGYIDGILNGARLSGIGTFQFLSCNELVISEELSGYDIAFLATHGNDDKIPVEA